MGILQSIFRPLSSNGGSFRGLSCNIFKNLPWTISNMGFCKSNLILLFAKPRKPKTKPKLILILDHFKNLLRRISNMGFSKSKRFLLPLLILILLFAKPRKPKPKPILPVVNPEVSTRNHGFLQMQEISSPTSDSSSGSSPGATYVPPSDLEWQRNYSDGEVESHVNADTYTPPLDLEWQRNYSDGEVESHVNADTYTPPLDLEWQRNYSDGEVESHVNADTYTPPLDLEWLRNYSNTENEVYANSSAIRTESVEDEDSSLDSSPTAAYVPPSYLEKQGNIESHVNADTYSPPSDLESQRDYSNTENEVYVSASWLQTPPVCSAIRTESVEDEDSNYNIPTVDVTIDVPTLQCSLAHKNAFDVVDSAIFIESEKNQLCPSDSREKVEEEKVVKSLVAEGKWIKHYNSNHNILLVGEGDFSFSASLAVAFGSAPKVIATSLDSEDFLKKNYTHAMSNIEKLRNRESKVMNEIDATNISNHHLLGQKKFDRIIYNFPHAGFFNDLSSEAQLSKHKTLVSLFLRNAKELISEDGEIHITHKTNGFHAEWDLESIASFHGLGLMKAVKFSHFEYPGYRTKYGFGGDRNFFCYPSKTYKFGLKSAQLQHVN